MNRRMCFLSHAQPGEWGRIKSWTRMPNYHPTTTSSVQQQRVIVGQLLMVADAAPAAVKPPAQSDNESQ